MANRWSIDDEVDELDEEFDDLVPAGRGRKPKKKAPVKAESEPFEDDREDKRRKRRWEAPPHKRALDFEPL